MVWQPTVQDPRDRALLEPIAIVRDPSPHAAAAAARQLTGRAPSQRITLRCGTVDLERGSIVGGDVEIRLSKLEVDLVAYLAARAGRDVDRDELQKQVWGHRRTTSSRAVDMAVSRLRRKIEIDPAEPVHLLTRRGGGYRFVLDPEPAAERGRPAERRGPPPRSRVVGRDSLLADIRARLDMGTRLLSLVGPPGAGKTTVANELVRRRGSEAVLVELAPVGEAGDILMAVAGALGLDTGRGSDRAAVQAQLARVLVQRAPIVVLDNAEHLVDAVAEVVRAWLATDGGAVFVVTSQVRLALVEEVVLQVPPLDLDDARQLFVHRCRAAGAVVDPADPELDDVLGLLDGVPLALDLAAARVPSLGLAGLAEALRAGRRVLRDRSRDRPARHASLDRALDIAWGRLEPEHQVALSQLSVFRGTFDWRGAQTLLARAPDGGPDTDEILDELLDRSLVRADAGRLRVLRPIAEYALRRGPTDAVATARQRHAGWVSTLGADLAARTYRRDAILALDQLVALAGDLLAAREHARSVGDLDMRTTVALALDRMWSFRADLQRRYESLCDIIADVSSAGRDDLLVRLLRARGQMVLDRGQIAESLADVERAGELAARLGLVEERIWSLLVAGDAHRNAGDLDKALQVARQTVDEAATCGVPELVDEARARLIYVVHYTRSGEIGADHAVELAAIRRRAEAAGALDQAVRVQLYLATVRNNEGDREAFRAARLRLLELHQGMPHRRIEPMVRCHLGIGLMQDERFVEADAHLVETVRLLEESDRPLRATLLAFYRSLNGLHMRRRDQVLVEFLAQREELAAGGMKRGEAHAWEGIALTHLDRGDTAPAVAALHESRSLAEASQDAVLMADSDLYLAMCEVVDGGCRAAAARLDALDLEELPADHQAFALAARAGAAAGCGDDHAPWLARFDAVAARPSGIAYAASLAEWRAAAGTSDTDRLQSLVDEGPSLHSRLLSRVWLAVSRRA